MQISLLNEKRDIMHFGVIILHFATESLKRYEQAFIDLGMILA